MNKVLIELVSDFTLNYNNNKNKIENSTGYLALICDELFLILSILIFSSIERNTDNDNKIV